MASNRSEFGLLFETAAKGKAKAAKKPTTLPGATKQREVAEKAEKARRDLIDDFFAPDRAGGKAMGAVLDAAPLTVVDEMADFGVNNSSSLYVVDQLFARSTADELPALVSNSAASASASASASSSSRSYP